jgi:uncharacterized protein YndB with AHSA1/START domain
MSNASPKQADSTPAQFTIERTLHAPVDAVWRMWTTREGLESWWGPKGFTSTVRHLDVRVGGRFEIAMTAVQPEIIRFLESSGLPTTSLAQGDYTEVTQNRRLAYTNAVDFVPGVAPYRTTTAVELTRIDEKTTRLVVTNDAMHDAHWTSMAAQGWEQQIGKLVSLCDASVGG